MENKADVIECCIGPMNYSIGNQEKFLVLMGNVHFPDINWEYCTAATSKPEKFLKGVEDNSLPQGFSEPARKDALPDWILVKRGHVGYVMVGGCLAYSKHKMVEFKISNLMRKKRSAELLL